MNPSVLSDDNCGCESGVQIPLVGDSSIVVRSKAGIVNGNIIKEYTENGKTVYELDDYFVVVPGVEFSNNAGIIEVGQTLAEATFTGKITPTQNPITTRTITPDPGGLDLTQLFSFIKSNVKRTSPGRAQEHLLYAEDNQGSFKSIKSWIPVKNAIYSGFNGLAILNQAEIKALTKHLKDTVLQQYGGVKNYVVPAAPSGPKHIYWSGPVGTRVPTGATLNGFTVPLEFSLTPVSVTNIHDGAISVLYWVVRTSERFDPGTYPINLLGVIDADEGSSSQSSTQTEVSNTTVTINSLYEVDVVTTGPTITLDANGYKEVLFTGLSAIAAAKEILFIGIESTARITFVFEISDAVAVFDLPASVKILGSLWGWDGDVNELSFTPIGVGRFSLIFTKHGNIHQTQLLGPV